MECSLWISKCTLEATQPMIIYLSHIVITSSQDDHLWEEIYIGLLTISELHTFTTGPEINRQPPFYPIKTHLHQFHSPPFNQHPTQSNPIQPTPRQPTKKNTPPITISSQPLHPPHPHPPPPHLHVTRPLPRRARRQRTPRRTLHGTYTVAVNEDGE